jgi:hypothetical protein
MQNNPDISRFVQTAPKRAPILAALRQRKDGDSAKNP